MKYRKLFKVLSTFILCCGLFGLYILKFFHTDLELEFELYRNSTDSQVLATHLQLPKNFKGKQLPFHKVYEPRQVGYPEDLKKPQHFNETKIILSWTPWNGVEKSINYYFPQLGNNSFVNYNCPNKNCYVTNDKKKINVANAVLFHLLDTDSKKLPTFRIAKQIWILYNLEPPWQIRKRIYPELSHLKNTFNWTMTYRRDSDILATYGFITANKRANFVPFTNKTKNVVWFVSDCNTDSKREDYVKELNKYIDVDIYGKCGTHKCYPSQSSVCYEEVIKNYKFYLSFENAICKDYVTEKFFNVFNYDIIPVVFGGVNYTSIAPKDTFIDATEYAEPKKLAIILKKIGNNESIYREILLRKQSFTAYLDPWMCRLCDKLHTSNEPSLLHDIDNWWLNEAQCRTWNKTTQNFEAVN